MGFLKGIWLGLRTLVSNPVKYLTNPVEAVTDTYRSDLEKEGLTVAQIDQAVTVFEDSGGVLTDIGQGYGSATKAVGGVFKSVGNILNFAGKNFTVILIIVVLIVAGWYFLMFRNAVK
jgi:actin-like ATPase involved in cell morphogenesis